MWYFLRQLLERLGILQLEPKIVAKPTTSEPENKPTTPDMVTIPEGHEVRGAAPQPNPGIWRMESGVWLIDFGPDTLDDSAFFSDIQTFLEDQPATSLLWVLQGSAIENFEMEPALLQAWFRKIYQFLQIQHPDKNKVRGHIFVMAVETPIQQKFAYLLLALDVSVHRPAPNGALFLELHSPQGITGGLAGPQSERLPFEARFILQANQAKDRQNDGNLAALEQRERELIRKVLQTSPKLNWLAHQKV